MSPESITIVILILFVIFFFWLWRRAKSQLLDLGFRKTSLSTRYGKMAEQFMPFLKNYPYNPEKFRFIGSPVDGINFEDDKIVFLEFKTAGSNLSESQKRIAELVWQKKVEFKEYRIE